MLHFGLRLSFSPKFGHDADKHVDASFPGVLIMNLFVPILWLTDATVGQGVTNMIRIGSKILFVAGMGDSLLEEVAVCKLEADPRL